MVLNLCCGGSQAPDPCSALDSCSGVSIHACSCLFMFVHVASRWRFVRPTRLLLVESDVWAAFFHSHLQPAGGIVRQKKSSTIVF